MILNRFNRFLFNKASDSGGDAGGAGAGAGDAAGGAGDAGGAGAGAGDAAGGAGDGAAAGEAPPEWFPKKYLKDGKPDHEALAKGYKELETKLGKGLPADVPATPEGYQLKPEKLPEGITWSDESAGKFAAVFHANGISPAAAKGIVDTFMDLEAQNLAQATKAYDDQLKADKVKLEEEWGGAAGYQKQAGAISEMVVGALGEDPGDAVLFSNPRIMRFLGKVVDQLGEDAQAALKGGAAPGASFTDGASLAKKIMTDASHPEHAAYMAGDSNTIRKVQRLLDGEN